jgi:small-conductance mechanosensitive channel
MNDLIAIAETVTRDHLVRAFALIAVGTLVTRLLFKRYPIGRTVARIVFLFLLTAFLLRQGIVPYQPLRVTDAPFRDAIEGTLKIAWWLWGTWFLIGLLRSTVVFERRPREGKLVQDVLSGLIYLAVAFAIIAYVFGLPVQGLLATSGAIAIILGLALQSTLNDVFSGLVLNFSRPYRPGDWITIEGGTEGRVVEMNWRATHILTGRRDLAIVPNSAITKSKIVNANSPSSIHGVTVTVRLDAGTSPARGTNILELAILNSRSILPVPEPTVRVLTIDAAHTEYELTFFVEELGIATRAQNELLDLAFRHVAASGAHLGPTEIAPSQAREEVALKSEETAAERVLGLTTIFDTLMPSERAQIAEKLKQATYEQGETLIEVGTVLQSLFIVGHGVLSVTQSDGELDKELLRLGPGDHFGEFGLLARAASGAKTTALAPSIVYELTKDDLAPILAARHEIAQELSRALARRQAAGRSIVPADIRKAEPTATLSRWFSERIHQLFELSPPSDLLSKG